MVAIGIQDGKSQRLIARELKVTETTIRRDLEFLGITASKKPTATIRNPAGVFKAIKPAIPDTKIPSNPTKPHPPAPRLLLPRPPKPRLPKQETPLSPEQLRQQHLEEMIQLVRDWFRERFQDCRRDTVLLDKARIHLVAGQDRPVKGLPERPMSAAELRDHIRPKDMNEVDSPSQDRREELSAQWLAAWLALWAPQDKQLRHDVLNQVRDLLTERR